MMNELMGLVNVCGYDAYLDKMPYGYEITFHDFVGFDDDWNEVFRDCDNPAAVDALLAWLDANCDARTDNLYTDYRFGDAVVRVGYTSFDI